VLRGDVSEKCKRALRVQNTASLSHIPFDDVMTIISSSLQPLCYFANIPPTYRLALLPPAVLLVSFVFYPHASTPRPVYYRAAVPFSSLIAVGSQLAGLCF
jgi:hypothetical protein